MVGPISSPKTKDPNPPPIAAVARATDELLWTLVKMLVAKKLVDPEILAGELREPIGELRRSGPLQGKTDEEREAAFLALNRVATELQQMV